MINYIRDQVVSATTSLFSHGPTPLANTLDYQGDQGLLGPDSISWRVIGDTAAFVGGIRALLVQAAHPEVVAGVEQHSRYRTDPFGRLNRTSFYVTETTYGSRPEVEAAVAEVRSAHRPVRGESARGEPYSAAHPELAAWVHNVLTESFLVAYQTFGPERLSVLEADQFVTEQATIGALLGASPLPLTANELSEWVADHPALCASDDQANATAFLRNPPLPLGVKLGYRPLSDAAVSTIPQRITDILDLHPSRARSRLGGSVVRSLRWTLGSSPSWHLALVRAGAPVPPGLFRQPLPEGAAAIVRAARIGRPETPD
ncbi:oxygenase MpaB family protein [Ilumatobacter sp.]|uniref:oxygenase MpaB family protein n=1 Tax=Ilumatobacter sp. TaxID=1967498 RepID=UPI003753358B